MSTKAADVPGSLSNPQPTVTYQPGADEHDASEPFRSRIAEMRDALARGESGLAAGQAAQDAANAELAASEGEPEPEAAAPVTEGVAPTAEEAAAADETVEEVVEGEEGQEGEEEEQIEGEAEPIVVALRPRREGEEPVEITVDDPEIAELLRANANDGLRRDEVNREKAILADQRAELDFIGGSLERDPISFLSERVKPEFRVGTVKHLLATMTEEEYQEVIAAQEEWSEDPKDRELTAHRLEKERRDAQKVIDDEQRAENEKQARARVVTNAVESLIPDSMDEEDADLFFRMAVEKIRRYAKDYDLHELPAERVPEILARAAPGQKSLLERFGIDTAAPARRAPAAKPAAPPAKAGVTEAAPDPNKAKIAEGAKRIETRVAARRAVTAVAPTGTGAAPVRTSIPKHETGQERIDWLRKNPGSLRTG